MLPEIFCFTRILVVDFVEHLLRCFVDGGKYAIRHVESVVTDGDPQDLTPVVVPQPLRHPADQKEARCRIQANA
jgi:hypothetical protein